MSEALLAEFLELEKDRVLEAALDLHNNGGNAPDAVRQLSFLLLELSHRLKAELGPGREVE